MFLTTMEPWRAIQILEYEKNQYQKCHFVDALNRGWKPQLRNYQPLTIDATVKDTDTPIQVLDMLIKQNADVLIMIDEQGKPKGTVEQKQVFSKLMLAMTKQVS